MSARFRVLAALAALVSGLTLSADVIVPSSAFSVGQNGAEFHSDVRVFNPTNAPVNVTPVFYNQANGQTVAAPAGFVTVPARGQVAFDNILATLFLQAKGAFGPIRFETPAPVIVSSSVNNVNACGAGATSGTLLPGVDVGQTLKTGTLVQLAASADAAGLGYHSNIVFTNPGTAAANVTTKLRNGDGTLVAAFTLDPLPANGFKQINNLSAWLPSPNTITDTNLWLEFTSDQPVLAFASVINNRSGDPFAIAMTPEPSVAPAGPLAPVANYTVSDSPMTGQAVTFTDTSSNSPVTRF
jgi:hypothetical protein